MSPNVNSFVHDLVAMATAMDRLPIVERELSEAKAENEVLVSRIDSIRADLEQSRTYAASLEQKVHDTEASRDDAELRFLEADDRMLKLERSFQRALEAMDETDKLIQSFKPVPPQPEPEPAQPPIPEAVQSIEPQPQGQGEDHPIEHSSMVSGDGSILGESSGPAPQPPASQDQSEVNPTNPVTEQATSASLNDAKNSDAGNTAEPKPSGPYTGKRYHDHPTYVSYWHWIDGGGTEEGYNWRPASDQTF